MPQFLNDLQFSILSAACDRMIPPDEDAGASAAGVPQYIDGLLGAFSTDPPRIWAGGAFSGRFGGHPGFARFHRLTQNEELAWRTRIEGSLGIAERERLGPVTGLQAKYRRGLQGLGDDFPGVPPDEQDRRLQAGADFTSLLYDHVCEGMYGAPEYGGNRDLAGWTYIGYLGDVQPRGYTDAEVSLP